MPEINANPPPVLFVLAGPNGAGKTTYFDYYLRPWIELIDFVNPDCLILAELGRAAPDARNPSGGRPWPTADATS